MYVSCMFIHGFIQNMMNHYTYFEIKKTRSIMDKSNYRPVALSSIISKVFEQIIFERLLTTDNQFGFEDQHSTDLCIFVLKECIRHYMSHGSNMYVCFLDATSAFDSLKHSKLFQKLND